MYNGYNLVGCSSAVALAILGHPPVVWIDRHGEGLELYGHVESLGLILEVPTRTDAVASLRLQSDPEAHKARELRAMAAESANFQRRRLLGRWWPGNLRGAANDEGAGG